MSEDVELSEEKVGNFEFQKVLVPLPRCHGSGRGNIEKRNKKTTET